MRYHESICSLRVNDLPPLFLYGELSIEKIGRLCVKSHKTQGLGLNPWFYLLYFANNLNVMSILLGFPFFSSQC